MDYEKAMKDLKEGGNYWKAPEGETVIIPKTELSEPKDDTINGKTQKRSEMTIMVGDQEKIWGIAIGGKNSTYGKLVAIGQKHKTLIGIPIRIIRQGMDKDNTKYIILDASRPAQ